VGRKNRLADTENVASDATFGMTSELGRVRAHRGPGGYRQMARMPNSSAGLGASSPVPGAA
jgi:hypothetical protein